MTTVVSLTFLRARQGEHLAFAFANASAKRDISRAIAHPLVYTLKEMVVTTVVSLTLLRAWQGERLAFAFANAIAKLDISRAIAHPLVPLGGGSD